MRMLTAHDLLWMKVRLKAAGGGGRLRGLMRPLKTGPPPMMSALPSATKATHVPGGVGILASGSVRGGSPTFHSRRISQQVTLSPGVWSTYAESPW